MLAMMTVCHSQFDIDVTSEAYRKMLLWRKEKNIDGYFKRIQEVDFDTHRVPYADLFER